MVEARNKGFVVRKAFKKERLKHAKWDVQVYKPEVKRVEASIARLVWHSQNVLSKFFVTSGLKILRL